MFSCVPSELGVTRAFLDQVEPTDVSKERQIKLSKERILMGEIKVFKYTFRRRDDAPHPNTVYSARFSIEMTKFLGFNRTS